MITFLKPILYGLGWLIAAILGIDKYHIHKRLKKQDAHIFALERELKSERRALEGMRDGYEKALREITKAIHNENETARINKRLDEIFAKAKAAASKESENEN